ncbi:alpha-amylase family protein [Actinophytocola oryzae]|uniref:Maltose alpha-D-glucosyltransferase/alpha-amylase n=1 Tax=Actinophytocola oryzae TaxID=502181 RepID=A0A4R7V4M8_9PSEU|nr:alpha-amylase family protein [Actinophytocola oryzae]TDV44309.1 maltose alpha-D-glucosyltransferase/alpha-amylase [Actinophytocola oryzae]
MTGKRTATSDLWWKNAVIYCLDVQTFFDTDGDGCGDLVGLTEKIDYLAGLGVTCLWLMPCYPSPERDDGYDISDFYAVDEKLGNLGDFAEMLRTAHDRGIRVIIDLVVNHTSHLHKWFQSARKGRDAPYHDYYVWADEKPENEAKLVFPGEETSNWAWDDQAERWYFHRFYSEQPDLNTANPAVRDEIAKIGAFWLALGVTGYRIDAVPFLLEEVSGVAADGKDPHALLRELGTYLTRRRGDAVLLGEVNLPYDKGIEFFGEYGDELNMMFDFRLNQSMFLALARRDVAPLVKTLKELPEIAPECQWTNFVRNHDELTLDQLGDAEREEVFAAFGPEEDMQVYGRGLRRRLPSMLDGDDRRVRLVYSLMFSLPGTPALFYGEEIGMVENLDVEGRLSSRTPMQWSDGPHAGFSSAPEGARLCRPLPEDHAANVADQRRDPHSLLNWMERLIRQRKECPEFGWGKLELLHTKGAVLVHRCVWDGTAVVAVHNLGDEPATVTLPKDCTEFRDLFGDDDAEPGEKITVEAYGFRWFRAGGHH